MLAFHQLPALLNKLERYEEAIKAAREAIQREAHMFGKFSDIVISSKGELAKALHWAGKSKEAVKAI